MGFPLVQLTEAFEVAVELMLSVGLGVAEVELQRQLLEVELERLEPLDMAHILKPQIMFHELSSHRKFNNFTSKRGTMVDMLQITFLP